MNWHVFFGVLGVFGRCVAIVSFACAGMFWAEDRYAVRLEVSVGLFIGLLFLACATAAGLSA
jgi:hypothetical protein